jgi:LysM repeat protein
MDDGSGTRRKPARYLAPLALAAVVASIYLVVQHSTNSAVVTTSSLNATDGRLVKQRHPVASAHTEPAAPTFYVVRPGDTLSEIATRTGISLTTLEQLNPTLQANAITVGQRVRLRR